MKRYQNLEITGSVYLTGSIYTPSLTASSVSGVLAATASYAPIAEVAIGADPVAVTNAKITICQSTSSISGLTTTHSLDPRTKYVEIEAIGGGGGGGGISSNIGQTCVMGNGGGGGAYVVKYWTKEEIGDHLDIVVGGGGLYGTYGSSNPLPGENTVVTPNGTESTPLVAAGGAQGANVAGGGSSNPQIGYIQGGFGDTPSNYDFIGPVMVGETHAYQADYSAMDSTYYSKLIGSHAGNILTGIDYSATSAARSTTYVRSGKDQYSKWGAGGFASGVKPYTSNTLNVSGFDGAPGVVIITEYITDTDI